MLNERAGVGKGQAQRFIFGDFIQSASDILFNEMLGDGSKVILNGTKGSFSKS